MDTNEHTARALRDLANDLEQGRARSLLFEVEPDLVEVGAVNEWRTYLDTGEAWMRVRYKRRGDA